MSAAKYAAKHELRSFERAPVLRARRNYIAGDGDGEAVGDASASELFFFELFLLEEELDDDFFAVPLF